MGGLQRAWSRIKAYLTTWKTTNFGNGEIDVDDSRLLIRDSYLRLTSADMVGFQIVHASGFYIGHCQLNTDGHFTIGNETEHRIQAVYVLPSSSPSWDRFYIEPSQEKILYPGAGKPIVIIWGSEL